jgi:hypothetical protein
MKQNLSTSQKSENYSFLLVQIIVPTNHRVVDKSIGKSLNLNCQNKLKANERVSTMALSSLTKTACVTIDCSLIFIP